MNSKFQRVLSCILAATMLVSLTACNSKNKAKVVKVSEDDPYYSVKEIEVYKADNVNDSVYVSGVLDLGDKIGVQVEIYKYYDYEATATEKMLEVNTGTEGSGVSEDVILEDESEGTVAVDETTVPEETVSEETGEETVPEETVEEPVIVDPGYEDMNQRLFMIFDLDGNKVGEFDMNDVLTSNDYVLGTKADSAGNLLMIVQSYDQLTGKQGNFILTTDMTGKEIKPRVELKFDEGTWPNSFVFDSAGNVFVSSYDEMSSGSKVNAYDSTGKFLFDVKVENGGDSMYLVDGVVYLAAYETNENSFKYNFYPIDVQAKKLGTPIDMTSIVSGQPVFTEDGIYLNKSGGVYSFDMTTSEQTQILSWNDTDLDLSIFSYGSMVPVSKEKMIIVGQAYNTSMEAPTEAFPVKMAILTKEAKNPNVGKEILVVAGLDIFGDTSITSRIYHFNKESTDYRVEIKDYAESFDYADYYSNPDPNAYATAYAALAEAMYLDMMNGEGPDIIMTSYGMSSLERFEAKGLLVDLYELSKKDETFDKANYVQSILSVYENDGKLFQFPLSFNLQGLVGPVRLIGDRTGWTVEQFNEMVNALPEGVLPMVNNTQSTLLSACLRASMGTFVDFSKNEVNFENDEFYKLLDLAKTYGQDDDAEVPMYSDDYYNGADGSTYVDPWELMSTGKLALTEAYVYGPSSISQHRYDFGEEVSFVGYPSADKSGLSCSVNLSFAISSESSNQQASWDFVKGFISEDYQNSQYNGIPVLQSALDKQLDKALNPPEQEGMYDMYYGYELTQEDADLYIELINAVSSKTQGDEQILAIILEEVPAYFNGQKTEQDVAAIIQNRVKTFVSEKS